MCAGARSRRIWPPLQRRSGGGPRHPVATLTDMKEGGDPADLTATASVALNRIGAPPGRVHARTIAGRALVAAPGFAFAKCYADPAPLINEAAAMQMVANAGLPAPAILLFEPGPPAILVRSWVGGDPLTGGEAQLRRVGRMLSQMHRIPIAPPLTSPLIPWGEMVLRWSREYAGQAQRRGLISERHADQVHSYFESMLPALRSRPITLTHGDLKPVHVLMDDAGEIAGVLDFADAGGRDPAWDLASLTELHPAWEPTLVSAYGDPDIAGMIAGYRLQQALGVAVWLAQHDRLDMAHAAAERVVRVLEYEIRR